MYISSIFLDFCKYFLIWIRNFLDISKRNHPWNDDDHNNHCNWWDKLSSLKQTIFKLVFIIHIFMGVCQMLFYKVMHIYLCPLLFLSHLNYKFLQIYTYVSKRFINQLFQISLWDFWTQSNRISVGCSNKFKNIPNLPSAAFIKVIPVT